MSELEASLRKITHLDNLPVKFCIFVDGLDEFDGDLFSISHMMQDLCDSTDVKLCVSSKPWNLFEDNFGHDDTRKLYVHELTQADIHDYAMVRLVEHPRWRHTPADAALLGSLVDEITRKADGVFLWVFLVTRLLREGLTNHDSFQALLQRLESLPSDLCTFFKHVLSSVEEYCHEKMSGMLQVALAATAPLPLEVYTFHDLEYSDENFALHHAVEAMDSKQTQKYHAPLERRLNGWCKGLLQIRHGNVEFIHRTVRDFLRTGDMIRFCEQKTSSTFEPHLSILRACIVWTKSTEFEN